MLTLYEELFLLYIHEDKGIIIGSAEDSLPYGLAGAILTELALLDKARVNESHRVELSDTALTGDAVLDEALKEIQASDRARKVGYWVNSLSQESKKFRKRTTEQLVEKGVVVQEDKSLLWVIPYPDSPEPKASVKYWIKNRLRTLVLVCREAELRDVALASLVQASNLMELVFTKDERKMAGRRIHELVVGEALKNPVAQAIEEIESVIASQVEDD